MSKCEPTWSTSIFEQARRPDVKSNFRGRNSSHMPSWFKKPGTPGRSDFIMWAKLPRMTYSAAPEKLYDFQKLRRLLADSECYVADVVERESAVPVVYPQSFYVGLALAGGAILYTLARR